MSTVFCWECGEHFWEEADKYWHNGESHKKCITCGSELTPDTVTSLTPKELAAHVRAQTITEITMARGRNETTT